MAGDRVRDEAERLVATALAALSYATRGLGGSAATRADGRPAAGFATGSPECCVCPVCRAIAAVRDPGSDLAERLAAGVGDLATGVTAILRTLSQRSGRAGAAEEPSTSEGDEFWENLRRKAADSAKAAARTGSTVDSSGSTVDDDPWRVATAPAPTQPTPSPPPPRAVAKKAVAKKAVAKKAVAQKTVAQRTVAQKTVAQKTVAQKAVAKKAVAGKTAAKRAGAGTGRRAAKKATPPEGTA